MLFDVAAPVMSNSRLSSDYNVIRLEAPEIAETALPGQFVMVKPQLGLDPILRRPFSIFEILRADGGHPVGVSLLNKRVGTGTSLLYAANPGDRIGCLGPLGKPFVPVDPPQEAWMVAGGVGLAPFASLAEALAARHTPMTLFYGARSASDLYYVDFFRDLDARLVLTTEDGSEGHRGRVTEPLETALADHAIADRSMTIYACGPTAMMKAVARLGQERRRPVFVSLEPAMGCGMGGCYSCVVPVRHGTKSHLVRSCLDGPVFDASAVVWDQLTPVH
jgi:dihydroorotate dehydrogenase electron transfer subunit